ncbi:hypothetical protein [Burkholderia stabilis]|uniref:hypothetical protein n=1 Tax=Burkholderia stabilis TaxID=95485 RepID=UPI001F4BA407|nr:hypothetical protein [Burkholderia stabilis]
MYPFTPAVSSLQIMGAWSRLADLACHVSDDFSRSLGLPPDLVLDGMTRVLGFRSAQGFATALRNGAVAAQVSRRCARSEGYCGRQNDIEYLMELANALKLGEAAPALVEAPSPPICAAQDKDYEDDSDSIDLTSIVEEALSGLREELLYTFSIGNSILSPNAFRQATILAEALLDEEPLGLREVGLTKTVDALCSARFPLAGIMPAELEAMIVDEDFTWAKTPRARTSATLKDLSEKFARESGGWVSAGQLRELLPYQPCDSFDHAYESGPSLFIALANAPSQVAFSMVDHDGVPAIFMGALAPNASDIDHLLMCSGAMPSTVDVLTREEAEAIAAPHLAGWYRLHWDL